MDGSDNSIGSMVTPGSAVRELRDNTTDGAAVLVRRAVLLSAFVAADVGDLQVVVDAVVAAVGSEAFGQQGGYVWLAHAAWYRQRRFPSWRSYRWVDCAHPATSEYAFETVANRFVTEFSLTLLSH